MKEFKDILKERRLIKKLTQEELGEKVGLKKAAIYKYENGINNNPSRDLISKLAKALEIDPAYLMGWTNTTEKPEEGNRVPLIGTIAAGVPITAEENIEQYFEIDPSVKADFALKIKGDSMIDAGINDGDIAFLRKQQTLETGEIGAVVIENEATLKRFYRTNSNVILQPENKEYQPIIVTDGDLHIAGKLVAVLNIVK